MPRTVTLTQARLADAQAIAVLSRNEVEPGLPWSWTPARVRRAILNRDVVVLAARSGEQFTGFAIMSFGGERAHLSLLAVAPGLRRRGIGSQLLAWLESSARVAGTFLVRLEVRERNLGARRFYRRQGYVEREVLPNYYARRETAVRMARDLRF